MIERPILMFGALVRAVLSGAKTQTRRLVRNPDGWRLSPSSAGVVSCYQPSPPHFYAERDIVCPFGVPGDRLWVRETWASSVALDDRAPTTFNRPDGAGSSGWPYWYAADDARVWTGAETGGPGFTTRGKWRPSIHMPRWASRISLTITSVRAERLQDITEEDAYAEGTAGTLPEDTADSARAEFAVLWDSLAPAGSKWADSPWIWRIAFERAA